MKELEIIYHALNSGLDLDIFRYKDNVFPVVDKIHNALLEFKKR